MRHQVFVELRKQHDCSKISDIKTLKSFFIRHLKFTSLLNINFLPHQFKIFYIHSLKVKWRIDVWNSSGFNKILCEGWKKLLEHNLIFCFISFDLFLILLKINKWHTKGYKKKSNVCFIWRLLYWRIRSDLFLNYPYFDGKSAFDGK